MSRITITRHANGEEGLVTGWDRPLATGFVDRYDEEGEAVFTRGPMNGERLDLLGTLRVLQRYCGVGPETLEEVRKLLLEHQHLPYPESNVCVDLSGGT